MKISFNAKNNNMTPEIENGVKIKYAPAKRKTSKAIWWIILLLVFSPFILLLMNVVLKWVFVSSAGALSMEMIPVRSVQNGIIERVCVSNDSHVKKGDPLIAVRPAMSAERIEQVALMKAERDALLKNPQLPSYTTTSTASGPSVDTSTLSYLRNELNTMGELMKAGAATRAEYNQAKERLLEAQRGARPKRTVTTSSSSAGSNAARIAYLDRSIKALTILSDRPFIIRVDVPGVVQTANAAVGYSIGADSEIMWIADPQRPFFIAYVTPENYDSRVRIGREATIVMLGTKRKIKAKVSEKPVNANNIPGGLSDSVLAGRRTVQVYLRPDEPLKEEELVNGLPVRVDWGIRFIK